MKLSLFDRIWVARGALGLDEQLDVREAFDRLAPLFDPEEVALDSGGTTLSYGKTNPEAQHKLATFSSGTLQFQTRGDTAEIVYRVRSPALLLTFLAPLLFLAFGQTIVGIGLLNQAMTAEVAEEEEEEDEEPGELHWLDQMLGVPAPEKTDKNDEEKEEEEEDDEHSPWEAYGLAGVFALLYLVGRILEPRLFRSALRKALSDGKQNVGNNPKNSAEGAPSTGL